MLEAMIELIDLLPSEKKYCQLNATLAGKSAKDIVSTLFKHSTPQGVEVPSISPVYAMEKGKILQGEWFTITIILEKEKILKTVRHFRKAGAIQVIVTPVMYIFFDED